MHLKIVLPAEKNYIECSEETHNLSHVVCRLKATKIMWSGTDQITWSIHVVRAEKHTPFLPPQVLYCNSCEWFCQAIFEIKSQLKI